MATGHRAQRTRNRASRTRYHAPGAAHWIPAPVPAAVHCVQDTGAAQSHRVPGTLCQLLYTCYQAVDTSCSIPGTGSGTLGTVCCTSSAIHWAPISGITCHASGARYQELAPAVLGAMCCALHQAAGGQHWQAWQVQCNVWHQHQVLHASHCTWAAGARHCSPNIVHCVPAPAAHTSTGYHTLDPAHPAAAPGSPLDLLLMAAAPPGLSPPAVSVLCLSCPCSCLVPLQRRTKPQRAGSKLSQRFLWVLPVRNPDGETLACPVQHLATQPELGLISHCIRDGKAPAPAQPGAGQAVQPTSRALLWWCLGPWVQGALPLASLALTPGPGAIGQGTALPSCHSWGSWHRASDWDIPALIINHPYQVVGSRFWTRRFCPRSQPRV